MMADCNVYSSPEKNTGLFWQAYTVVLHMPPAYIVVGAAPASGLNVMVPPGMETRVLPKDTCGSRVAHYNDYDDGYRQSSCTARAGGASPKTWGCARVANEPRTEMHSFPGFAQHKISEKSYMRA